MALDVLSPKFDSGSGLYFCMQSSGSYLTEAWATSLVSLPPTTGQRWLLSRGGVGAPCSACVPGPPSLLLPAAFFDVEHPRSPRRVSSSSALQVRHRSPGTTASCTFTMSTSHTRV